jgi:hypothetical protein
MATEAPSTPEEHAAKRVKDYTDLMWHVASYVIINVFLWLSVPYVACWVTIAWVLAATLFAHGPASLGGDASAVVGGDGGESVRVV